MTKRWLLAAIILMAVALLNSQVQAKQGTVKTRDGQSLTGDVDDSTDPQNIIVIIHGVKTSVDRTNVLTIDYQQDFSQQFQDRLNNLGPRDVKGRLALASWALDNKQYDLARKAAQEARTIDPRSEDVATMLDTIQAMQAQPARVTDTSVAPPTPTPKPMEDQPVHFLDKDQINQVREFEMQAPADKNIQVSFTNDVVARYQASSGTTIGDFNSLSSLEKAQHILQTGDPKLIRDMRIASDPVSLVDYRTKIHTRVLAGCAAANCHGGENGGNFFLYRNTPNAAAWYTDFYILQMYQRKMLDPTAVGPRTPVAFPMIDRTNAANSLLLQYGLPAKLATLPHPDVPGWKAIFTGPDDPTYQEMAQWMGKTLKPFPADYGFKFTLPTGKPATQPTAPLAPAPAPTPKPAAK